MSSIIHGSDPRTTPSFTINNRIARFIWGFFYVFVFKTTPRPFHHWRVFLLRCFGATIGKNCRVGASAVIWAPWNLVMGDRACLADRVTCYSMATISLGNGAIVSQGSHLCTGSHDYETPNLQLYAEPIEIGDEAWLCAETFVCPGIKIGTGAVVGARSVVTNDIPNWMVCAGNPCKPIKPRIIEKKI
jgi:putative colanic acid biosynthesis acetyltransferase WcaF